MKYLILIGICMILLGCNVQTLELHKDPFIKRVESINQTNMDCIPKADKGKLNIQFLNFSNCLDNLENTACWVYTNQLELLNKSFIAKQMDDSNIHFVLIS